jgi:class III poly(R)-hydroxyalkanoic acid synthase PhaE subunit
VTIRYCPSVAFALHSLRCSVAADAWRQWGAFAALFNPMADASAAGAIRGSPAGFAPFFDAERFAAAVRAFQQSGRDSPTAAAALSDFLRDQFGGVLDGMWGSSAPGHSMPPAAEAPALGPTREQQEHWQRVAAAWQRLQEAQRRLQRLWSDALCEAATAFVSRPAAAAAPQTPEAVHGLYDAWINCAEEAYARMAHGEAFGTALAAAVQAASEWRDESAASIEPWAKWLDWPTRAEINSLALRVRALEEQQRESNRNSATAGRRAAKKRAAPAKKRTARGQGKR